MLTILADPAELPTNQVVSQTGPLIIGFLISFLFYGIVVLQTYNYFLGYPKDHKAVKYTVGVLFIIETIFTVFLGAFAYSLFGSGWGNPNALLVLPWGSLGIPYPNGLAALVAQSFYVWRIWQLSKSILLCFAIEALALVACGAIFAFGVEITIMERFDKLKSFKAAITIWSASSATCDILITVSIIWMLHRAKNPLMRNSTNFILSKLIQYTVETGLLTSVFAIAELTLWLASRGESYIYFPCYAILGRLYANALLAILNSRIYISDAASKRSAMGSSLFPSDGMERIPNRNRGIAVTLQSDIVIARDGSDAFNMQNSLNDSESRQTPSGKHLSSEGESSF